MAEEVIEMFVALAFALLLVPLAVLYVCEWMARAGRGPLADPDRLIVLDCTIVPMVGVMALADPGTTAPAQPLDAERCAAESRLVAALIAGDLDRAGYREGMAELAAADAATHP